MTSLSPTELLRRYPDVRKKLRRRFALPFVIYRIWLVLLATVSIWVIVPILDPDSMVVAPTVLLAAVILPIFLLKLPKRLKDRSYRGVVRSCRPYNYRQPIIVRTRQDDTYIPHAEVTVENKEGKLLILDLPLPDPYAPPPWKEGDELIHFRGCPLHLQIEALPTTCLLCRGRSPEGSERCVFCHHPLIQVDLHKEADR